MCLCMLGILAVEAGMLRFAAIFVFCICGGAMVPFTVATTRPNIIFLLTDDQDLHSLDYMPHLNQLLREEGMEFLNCFVPTSLCSPSRATILRSQYTHNTKVYDNGEFNNSTFFSGGFQKFIAEDLESSTIATQLNEVAGYETFLIGKYLNGYEYNYTHVPRGWDHWYGMLHTSRDVYYGTVFSVNGELLKTSTDTYQTDYISDISQSLLLYRDKSKPFFMYIAPFAPHAPATPAHRHENMFSDKIAPRHPSFNPNESIQQQKPSWIGQLPPLNASQICDIDQEHRNRLRSLQAVDEMLKNITLFLQEEDIENNTYMFYMSDNGLHLGDFRMKSGKRQAYDTDTHVPLLVRGPGIEGGMKVSEVVMSVDLLPTWVELANTQLPSSYKVDGKSIVPLLFRNNTMAQPKENKFRSVALVEHYGTSSAKYPSTYSDVPGFYYHRFLNNTYQGVRVINGCEWDVGSNWLYTEWCTDESEFYNMTADPFEMFNTVNKVNQTILKQLSALTKTLANCAGSACFDIDLASLVEEEDRMASGHLACLTPVDEQDVSKAFYDLVDLDHYDSNCKYTDF